MKKMMMTTLKKGKKKKKRVSYINYENEGSFSQGIH